MINGMRVITLEEHFATPDYSKGEGGAFVPDFAESIAQRISDVENIRLPEMDAAGIDVQVLSLTTPGVQGESGSADAVIKARRSNDVMAKVVREHPERFAAFGALPTQDPQEAVNELKRVVLDLGFKGVLVNGHTAGAYLDDPRFDVLWAELSNLKVPLYIHPAFSPAPLPPLQGYPELAGPVWGWGFETASHALRLVAGGVFDRHPEAQILLGHMGEGLPFTLDRLDDRWAVLQHASPLARKPSDYIRENMYVTTAGVESAPPLHCALQAMGSDRVLFSVDYPYQSAETATEFLRTVEIEPSVKEALASGNAAKLLSI
ncbi:amidohydrolase family protein [Pseudarthrobacter sp. NS4]|uniref:amidohydrolase family protein n=1 Tax=Pseudarthrobacter sp. NS4 TaxID=2973976 RepID=UPI002163541A|nr:amidohydrolase family protein [Pseudarthrobacter sp. NS4]